MKKLTKSSLSILLATLLLLSLAPAASAAPSEEPAYSTLTITAPGKAEASLYVYDDGDCYLNSYDLSGLVFKAEGGRLAAPVTAAYDEVTEDSYREKVSDGKINWYFGVYVDREQQPGGWRIGSNKAFLRVTGYQYTNFQVEEVIGGVEYGAFDEVFVFEGEAPFTLECAEETGRSIDDFSAAAALALNTAAQVNIPGVQDEDPERVLFKFTPEEDGCYLFKSAGAKYNRTLYTIDGDSLYFTRNNPWAQLYDENGRSLAYSDRDYYGATGHYYNFALYYNLEKGKTYYLQTSTNAYDYDPETDAYRYLGGDYTVTVELSNKKLVAPAKNVTIKYGEYLDLAQLLQGTTWDLRALDAYSWGYSRLSIFGLNLFDYGEVLQRVWNYDDDYWWNYSPVGFEGSNRGTATIQITAPDGEQVEINVTVEFSLLNWLQFLLMFGWSGGGMPNSWNQMLGGGLLQIEVIPIILMLLPFLPIALLGIWLWNL